MTGIAVGKVGSAVYLPGATVGPRRLTEFQFVWILRGSARWRSPSGTTELRPGQLLLVRPGTPDFWLWDRHEPTTHGYAYFDFTGSWRPSPESGWPVLRSTDGDDPLRSVLRYLLRQDSDKIVAAELVRCALVLFTHRAGVHDPNSPAAVDAVIEHVYRAWTPSGIARALSLRELASAAAVSTGHLSRVFRDHFGVGPITAIELLRLARAATLLTESDLPLAAVARSCGFADPGHFSHRFRRAYHLPPGQYRRAADAPDPSALLATNGLLPLAARLLP
ncbi:AraC family transcriptional regulator [Allokutzneria sp. A3M-2-11 16]|uniref:AraC family transcriptional regulator n=1 Tax=Allokutzneria sp. A3M-2-11 16 TaxID=2962043 RepID=UPI0020B88424|nr:AraC family transcriptional regulator [Allokutzneria sp. A3M-2-11 16]MCP3805127.1 AraC family transcriptional regulator [Allokutzneria sp. A3M-2-11 16]